MILRFHPELQELFPENIQIEAATPLDALKLIAVQHPLCGKIKPVPVKIKQLKTMLEINDPTITDTDRVFDVVPADSVSINYGYLGAGGENGWLNIAIGVVLIVVAVVAPYAAPALFTTYGAVATSVASAVLNIGVAMVISGVMQLLAPTPKMKDDRDGNYSSRTFGAKTTTEVGTPIQLVFGKYKIGFHLFSFNVEARNYSGVDDPEDSPYFTGKVDENLPNQNLNKYYGFVQAGDKVIINQVDNATYRTGSEF